MLARLAYSLAFLALAVGASAQNRETDLKSAFSRSQHLKRGINASIWFAQSDDYSARHTDTETTPEDIATIARLGFDNVRLSIDAAPLQRSFRGDDKGDFLARLDKAVDEILGAGMAVQIDLHPSSPFKEQVRTNDGAVDRLVILWRRLAQHYAGLDREGSSSRL